MVRQDERPRADTAVVPGQQTVIASYATYQDAERAVDYLSDNGFPVHRVAIIGRGVRSVEQVTGRLTIWGAAGRSGLTGAVLGALFGWLFGAFNWISPLISSALLALYGAIFGAVLGGVFGVITHGMTGGRRDFSSVSGLEAESYEVIADTEVAPRAAQLLGTATLPRRG
jgi:hypothetical protein